jgi:hypothetical protein
LILLNNAVHHHVTFTLWFNVPGMITIAVADNNQTYCQGLKAMPVKRYRVCLASCKKQESPPPEEVIDTTQHDNWVLLSADGKYYVEAADDTFNQFWIREKP